MKIKIPWTSSPRFRRFNRFAGSDEMRWQPPLFR
jgi:hypothetical protein